MKRSSPLLSHLPRREIGAERPAAITVKLRRSTHRGKKRPVPEIFTQLTVPAPFADLLPDEARFELTMHGEPGHEELRYRRVSP